MLFCPCLMTSIWVLSSLQANLLMAIYLSRLLTFSSHFSFNLLTYMRVFGFGQKTPPSRDGCIDHCNVGFLWYYDQRRWSSMFCFFYLCPPLHDMVVNVKGVEAKKLGLKEIWNNVFTLASIFMWNSTTPWTALVQKPILFCVLLYLLKIRPHPTKRTCT